MTNLTENVSFLDSLVVGLVEEPESEISSANPLDTYLNYVREKIIDLRTDPNINLKEADTRFSTALPLHIVRNKTIVLIGLGGIGNWVWKVLLGMGFENVFIIDDDIVSLENVGPQGHDMADIGLSKVQAVQNKALQYRGIELSGLTARVYTFKEIHERIGYTPDIVIGATDDAGFRASMVDGFTQWYANKYINYLPELYIDCRMSLGDWTCYTMPLKLLVTLQLNIPYGGRRSEDSIDVRRFTTQAIRAYTEDAIFTESDAMQEACTERAISYTGANIASYIGALLHWWVSIGKSQLHAEDIRYLDSYYNNFGQLFSWKKSNSSRDFSTITPSITEVKLRKMYKEAVDARRASQVLVDNLRLILENKSSSEFATITKVILSNYTYDSSNYRLEIRKEAKHGDLVYHKNRIWEVIFIGDWGDYVLITNCAEGLVQSTVNSKVYRCAYLNNDANSSMLKFANVNSESVSNIRQIFTVGNILNLELSLAGKSVINIHDRLQYFDGALCIGDTRINKDMYIYVHNTELAEVEQTTLPSGYVMILEIDRDNPVRLIERKDRYSIVMSSNDEEFRVANALIPDWVEEWVDNAL